MPALYQDRWITCAADAIVKPFITPDDVPAVEEVIKQQAGLADIPRTGLSPVI